MCSRFVRSYACALLACVSLAGCCDDGVHTVSLGLRPNDQETPAFIWPGDTVTVSAWAGTESRMFCYRLLYTNENQPSRFTYRSSDTTVATLDRRGFLVARSFGTTTLTTKTAGVESFKIALIVVPAIASIRLTATATTLTVGDTIVIRAEAFDSAGNRMTGALAGYSVRPDSIVRAVNPPPQPAPAYKATLPLELRVRAVRSGQAIVVVNGATHSIGSISPAIGESINLVVVPTVAAIR